VLAVLPSIASAPDPPESVQALLGAALAATALATAPLVMDMARRWVPERNQFFARWGFTHLSLAFLIYLASFLVVPTVWVAFSDAELGLTHSLVLMTLVFLAPSIYILRCALRLDPDGVGCLGFRPHGNLRGAALGITSYALLSPAILGLMLLWPWVVGELTGENAVQESVKGFLELDPERSWLPLILAVAVLPFFEELLFRAFLQPLLVQNFTDRSGVVVTSVIFAALHGLSAFLPIFALSLILGGVMLRTQRFAACWAVHALHNGLVICALLYLPEARELVEGEAFLTPFFLR
jgi:membrane protease YdiL (CAAX protease family)